MMTTQPKHPRRLGLLLVLAAVLALGATAADAARPPIGRTYFTSALGLEAAYALDQQCFEFFEDKLCSVDGLICGSWQRAGGGELGFAFDLNALVEGELMQLEGLGRLETSGSKSSLAGTGSYRSAAANKRGVNFAFAAREIGKEQCLALLEENAAEDDEVVVGSGIPATEDRDVSDFHAVAASGVGQIDIRHGAEESLRVTADDNLLPILTSEVRDGRLILGSEGRFRSHDSPRYEVTLRNLDELLLAGVFGVDATGLDTGSFDINVSGVSAVTVAGNAQHQNIAVAGVSIYDARNLTSRTVEVDISGPSRAVVRASERIEGHLTGGATLEYIGNPTIDVTVDFTSTLRKIG